MTVESVVKTATVQADGTISVQESHTRNGQVYSHLWTAPVGWTNADIIEACTQRGQSMEQEMVRREQIDEEANHFVIPLSPLDFARKFTPTEWFAFKSLADTDATAGYLWTLFSRATSVSMTHPDTRMAIGYLQATGILTPVRANEVLQ